MPVILRLFFVKVTYLRFRLAVLLRCREMTKFASHSTYLWR